MVVPVYVFASANAFSLDQSICFPSGEQIETYSKLLGKRRDIQVQKDKDLKLKEMRLALFSSREAVEKSKTSISDNLEALVTARTTVVATQDQLKQKKKESSELAEEAGESLLKERKSSLGTYEMFMFSHTPNSSFVFDACRYIGLQSTYRGRIVGST
jgi:hypothetical protein